MSAVFSFNESLKNVQIPVVTLNNNNKSLNFILDTGSSISSIDKKCLKELDYQPLSDTHTSMGIEGSSIECEMCGIYLTDNIGNKFVDIMTIMDMSAAFDYIKDTDNIEINGILGNTFFTNYECILDYKKKQILVK